MKLKTLHELPKITSKWGYDHAPNVYNKVDLQWENITGDGSFLSGLLRLVSGRKGKAKFSRGPDSWISLDTASVGIAHWWAKTLPRLFSKIAQEQPELAAWAWGEEVAEEMTDEEFLLEHLKPKRGKGSHKKKFDWLLAGWYEIARHPDIIQICVREWVTTYEPASASIMSRFGWELGQTKAGLIRITNSRGSAGMARMVKKGVRDLGTRDEKKVMPFVFETLYEKPKRWSKILSMKEFKQPFRDNKGKNLLQADLLDYASAPIIRVDESEPKFTKQGDLLICRSIT